MGIQLAAAGYDFTIFDRADGFGGTWRNNTYPGAACDVPSHFYSYSFALNPRWSKTFAQQPEILAYLERVAADHGLADHLVAQHPRHRDCGGRRRAALVAGDRRRRDAYEFDAVVSAVGMLDVPNIPDDSRAPTDSAGGRFTRRTGTTRNRLQASVSRRSAPAPAPSSTYPRSRADAAHLTVFQRTPIWVSPRYDEPFTAEQQELFERDPGEARKVRDAAFAGLRGRQLRRRLGDDEGPDGYGPRIPDPQGGRPRTARQARPRRIRSAASGPCSRAPGFRRSRGRT